MREILEDAHAHMDDGYGRAQAHVKQALTKRFYKKVEVEPVDNGFAILLDGRRTKTPGRVEICVPSKELAQHLVDEWSAQDTHIDASTMPMVRLVNSAIEGGVAAEPVLRAEILKFIGNDLLLFRADNPKELMEMQNSHWNPVLAGISKRFGVEFIQIAGILHKDQPKESLVKLERYLGDLDFLAATALMSITSLTGSGILATALRVGLIDHDTAWLAAHVDEDYNAMHWGQDEEAIARRKKRRVEFDTAVKVLELVETA